MHDQATLFLLADQALEPCLQALQAFPRRHAWG
jgi:hypothetical protein